MSIPASAIIKSSLFEGLARWSRSGSRPSFFAAAEQGRLFGLPLEGRWLHVGSPEAIEEAEMIYAAADGLS